MKLYDFPLAPNPHRTRLDLAPRISELPRGLAGHPRLGAWYERFSQRPSARA